jgi:hypothetical protein
MSAETKAPLSECIHCGDNIKFCQFLFGTRTILSVETKTSTLPLLFLRIYAYQGQEFDRLGRGADAQFIDVNQKHLLDD